MDKSTAVIKQVLLPQVLAFIWMMLYTQWSPQQDDAPCNTSKSALA